MIITKASHLAVVAAKDEQIKWLQNELAYYRFLVLGLRQLPDWETITAPTPAASPAPIATTGWTEEEQVDYDNWCRQKIMLYGNGDPQYLQQLYREENGDRSPSDVMNAE